ncbi:hypothetical protein JOC54_002012 [Alkalihalobacillus xiaoxiensis]|uniref:Uncharacterized protein n=1 Tax=Shouchella xiaoxiensis TaxID=766895 RepID=A0ABS2STC1_9BACI|nr:hypothetical protein [Shouchella xiaoxiensis]MBM7838753.1 hypothetical protein [Shouchella xiaoxiensis]
MKRTLKNIGVLNLLNATEKSIENIEAIKNVGVVIYSSETAHLIPMLNIKNLGESICTGKDIRLITGMFTIDAAFLRAATEPLTLVVTGIVTFAADVTEELIKTTKCRVIIVGVTFTPNHLKGYVNLLIEQHTGVITGYKNTEPIFRAGEVELTNGLLQSLTDQSTFVVNGSLSLSPDLDFNHFSAKIAALIVNGGLLCYQNQEAGVMSRTTINGTQTIIPTDYTILKSTMQLTNRSIRRFKNQAVHASKPLIIQSDVTREAFSSAFKAIDSSSYLICHENLEDLAYEALDQLETDVFTYSHHLKYVEKEEWGNAELEAISDHTLIVVAKTLTLRDVTLELLQQKNISIILLGEIHIPDPSYASAIRSFITVNNGVIVDLSEKGEDHTLANMGQLTL